MATELELGVAIGIALVGNAVALIIAFKPSIEKKREKSEYFISAIKALSLELKALAEDAILIKTFYTRKLEGDIFYLQKKGIGVNLERPIFRSIEGRLVEFPQHMLNVLIEQENSLEPEIVDMKRLLTEPTSDYILAAKRTDCFIIAIKKYAKAIEDIKP